NLGPGRRSDEPARDAQLGGPGRREHEDEVRLLARAAVGEEQLVAARTLERSGAGLDAEEARGEATADVGVGDRMHDDGASVAREADRDGVRAVVAPERHVVRDEEPGRRALEDRE